METRFKDKRDALNQEVSSIGVIGELIDEDDCAEETLENELTLLTASSPRSRKQEDEDEQNIASVSPGSAIE